jgi:hypothetical protein
LSQNLSARQRPYKLGEGLITAISLGAVFILIGVIFVTTPDLWSNIVAFFNNFTTTRVSETNIYLPAPANPAAHAILYSAVAQFSLGIGILQVLALALRLVLHSPINRTAETVGNLVFWFGATCLTITLLNDSTTVDTWFVFWAAILVVLGISLIARALVLFARK